MRKVKIAKTSRLLNSKSHSLPISCDISLLTRSEVRLLYVLADSEHNAKTVVEKCQLAKVSRETYYRAVAKPLFREAQREIARAIISQNLIQLMDVGVKQALKGSFLHWNKLMEMGEMISTVDQGANGEITIRFADPRAKTVVDITPLE